MGNVYLYISSVALHWWPLVTAGSLFGLEEFAQRYCAPLKRLLDKIPDDRRKNFRTLALIVAALYSGYLAWSDEHEARIKAEKHVEDLSIGPLRQIDLPILHGTIIKKHGYKFLLGQIAPIYGDKTTEWNVSVTVPGAKIAKFILNKPDNYQGDIVFYDTIDHAGSFHTKIGSYTPIYIWINPTYPQFISANPKFILVFRAVNGQTFTQELPMEVINK